MKLTCPACGAIASVDAWGSDAAARQTMREIAELPGPVSRCAVGYLALFRTGSGRGLKWGKALRLLADLRLLVTESYIQWDHKPARPNRAEAWGRAMERVIAHPPKRLPLTSHGYLHAVAWEIADDMDKKSEARRIADERTGHYQAKRAAASTVSREQIQAAKERIAANVAKLVDNTTGKTY